MKYNDLFLLSSNDYNADNGIGRVYSDAGDTGARALLFGGSWRSGTDAGLVALYLGHDSSTTSNSLGLRCVVVPWAMGSWTMVVLGIWQSGHLLIWQSSLKQTRKDLLPQKTYNSSLIMFVFYLTMFNFQTPSYYICFPSYYILKFSIRFSFGKILG
jgi:hypothetical protein